MVERRRLKRVMKDFVINEISLVDAPAQQGARVTIMKRDDTLDKNGDCPQVASLAPVQQDIEAMDFEQVLAEQKSREAVNRVRECVLDKWYALQRAFETIAGDDDVAPADKVTRMKESLAQFLDAVRAESETITEAITKSLSAVPGIRELLPPDGSEGGSPMTDAEKKQIDDLQKSVADLTAKLEAATAKEPAKKAADLAGELEKAKADLAELTEKLAKSDAALVDAQKAAKMSDEEKEYMQTLEDDEKRAAFMRMSGDDRKKAMKVKKDADPVVYKSERTGEEFRKSDDPRLVKYARQADEYAQIAKAEREARETAELTKRADEEPYKHLPGDAAKKVDVLRAISKMAEEPRAELEKMLAAGGKAIAAAFQTIGHSRDAVAKSAADFEKRVTEIAQRDKLPRFQAMEKARAEYPEEFRAYAGNDAASN
ncbi:MAG: hypothetical protein K8E66_12000 [Phycisphaerales bacterium]|nr:hypothetical protein [Phycisphaerales bacterium]